MPVKCCSALFAALKEQQARAKADAKREAAERAERERQTLEAEELAEVRLDSGAPMCAWSLRDSHSTFARSEAYGG